MLSANGFQVNCFGAVRWSCVARPDLPGSFVNANIFFRGSAPGEVLAHSVAHELLPGGLIAEGPQGFLDRQQQSLAVVVGELETSSLAGAGIPMFDGVVETSGGAHHGHSPVLQAVY